MKLCPLHISVIISSVYKWKYLIKIFVWSAHFHLETLLVLAVGGVSHWQDNMLTWQDLFVGFLLRNMCGWHNSYPCHYLKPGNNHLNNIVHTKGIQSRTTTTTDYFSLFQAEYEYFNPLGNGDLKFYQSEGLSTFGGFLIFLIKPVFYLS